MKAGRRSGALFLEQAGNKFLLVGSEIRTDVTSSTLAQDHSNVRFRRRRTSCGLGSNLFGPKRGEGRASLACGYCEGARGLGSAIRVLEAFGVSYHETFDFFWIKGALRCKANNFFGYDFN